MKKEEKTKRYETKRIGKETNKFNEYNEKMKQRKVLFQRL